MEYCTTKKEKEVVSVQKQDTFILRTKYWQINENPAIKLFEFSQQFFPPLK